MSVNFLAVSVSAKDAPRGAMGKPVTQEARTFKAQSMTASFAWGSSPGTATLKYVGNAAPIQTGAWLELRLGSHLFCGLCKSDVLNYGSSEGTTRTLQFVDLREYLQWDWVFCAFNKLDVRMVNGVRQKRYWHIYPRDYDTLTKTYTYQPLTGAQILQALFQAPTVGTAWSWDLTDRGLFPNGVMGAPVYNFDALDGGKRLDAALNEICERLGCVFALISTVQAPFRLVFTRKGYGPMPTPTSKTDENRQGVALSGHPTNVRVLGERNLYQVMDVPLEPDWARAWEKFMVFETFADDVYRRFGYDQGANDPEGYIGRQQANARALSITVREYAAAAGEQFADGCKFYGRWRMDMPAALYISQLLFRAFRPSADFRLVNARGDGNGSFTANAEIPLTSLDIADRLLCRVYQEDPTSGTLQYDLRTPADGNGYAIVKGYMVGADLFKSIGSAQFTVDFFKNASNVWSHVPFQIDDSGEGVRFIIFDEPVILSQDLIAQLDGHCVVNAGFTMEVPPVRAALVFEAERFSYWMGTWPNSGRDTVEKVGGLNAELVVDNTGYTEVPYTNGVGAEAKAQEIARAVLLRQYLYTEGGYKEVWKPGTPIEQFGTALTSMTDRIAITTSPREGTFQVTDYTNERGRDYFEPERELDRRTVQNSLFPGQQELRYQAEASRKLAAAFKQMPGVGRQLKDLLAGQIGSDQPLEVTWFTAPLDGAMPAGTVLRRRPVVTTGEQNANTVPTHPSEIDPAVDTVFAGVTVTHNVDGQAPFKVQRTGLALTRVQGPVSSGEAVGLNDGAAEDWEYLVKGGSNPVGICRQDIADESVRLVQVDLGVAGVVAQAYRVKGEYLDYLGCVTWDGTNEGETEVAVAKEHKTRCSLRAETVLGVDHTYSYSGPPFYILRHDNDGATEQLQRIIPPWVPDEVVYAIPANTGVLDVHGKPVQLLVQGRSAVWAKKKDA